MLQAHEITHPDWIRFHGSSEINGDKITLRANVGGGVFEMRVSDVWISGEITRQQFCNNALQLLRNTHR